MTLGHWYICIQVAHYKNSVWRGWRGGAGISTLASLQLKTEKHQLSRFPPCFAKRPWCKSTHAPPLRPWKATPQLYNWFTVQPLLLRQIFEVLNRVVTQPRRGDIIGFIFIFLSLFFCRLQKSSPGGFQGKDPTNAFGVWAWQGDSFHTRVKQGRLASPAVCSKLTQLFQASEPFNCPSCCKSIILLFWRWSVFRSASPTGGRHDWKVQTCWLWVEHSGAGQTPCVIDVTPALLVGWVTTNLGPSSGPRL